MKKFYKEIELEIIKFSVEENMFLLISDQPIFGEENDGNTTTVPGDW